MEIFGILTVPNWMIVFTVAFYISYLYLKRKYGVFESLGVPGPTPLPFVGNSLEDLFSMTHEMDIKNTKKYGRIFSFYERNKPSLRVSDPEFLKEVMVKQFNNFTDRRHFDVSIMDPVMAKIMSILHGEEWKMTRNVMSPTFTSGKLKQMVPLMDKCSEKLVDTLYKKADTGESVNAKDIYISYLIEIIGTCAFGVEINSDEKDSDKSFLSHARRIVFPGKIWPFFILMMLPKKLISALNIKLTDVESLSFIKKTLTSVIEARQSGNQRRNDFLQIMLDALKEANANTFIDVKDSDNREKENIKTVLTSDGVLAQSILFLIAGFETTSNTLSYLSYNVATNPECQDKLIEEVDRILEQNEGKLNWDTISQMTYMDMFIAETLRMYPALTRIDRQCTEETQIGELRIPKDTIITALVYAMHHDEEFYPDPYKFDPERFAAVNKDQRNPYTYLSFGIGPRNCIGMRFAQLKVKLTLIHMMKNFRFSRAPTTKEPIVFKKGHLILYPEEEINVLLAKR